MAISDGERVIGVSLGKDLESTFVGEVRGRRLMGLMVKEGGEVWTIVVMGLSLSLRSVHLMTEMLHVSGGISRRWTWRRRF